MLFFTLYLNSSTNGSHSFTLHFVCSLWCYLILLLLYRRIFPLIFFPFILLVIWFGCLFHGSPVSLCFSTLHVKQIHTGMVIKPKKKCWKGTELRDCRYDVRFAVIVWQPNSFWPIHFLLDTERVTLFCHQQKQRGNGSGSSSIFFLCVCRCSV